MPNIKEETKNKKIMCCDCWKLYDYGTKQSIHNKTHTEFNVEHTKLDYKMKKFWIPKK